MIMLLKYPTREPSTISSKRTNYMDILSKQQWKLIHSKIN